MHFSIMMSIELLGPIFSLNLLIPLRSSFLRWFLILRAHGTACQCWALPWLFFVEHHPFIILWITSVGRMEDLQVCVRLIWHSSLNSVTHYSKPWGPREWPKLYIPIPTNFGILLFPMKRSMLPPLLFFCRAIYRSTGSSESSAPKGKTFFPQELQPVTFSGKFCWLSMTFCYKI